MADFDLRINMEARDVIAAVQFLGSQKLANAEALRELFSPRFNETLEVIALKMDFEDDDSFRERYREEVLKHIGMDLNGLILDDLAIHHLEPVGKF